MMDSLWIILCEALFKTVYLNLHSLTKHRAFNKAKECDSGSRCLFELAGLLVGNDYEVSSGSRLYKRGERERRSVKPADGWPASVLIMATLVCWEATLCSRSMGAEEWRSIMTRALCTGTSAAFKGVKIFNMSSGIHTRLLQRSSKT